MLLCIWLGKILSKLIATAPNVRSSEIAGTGKLCSKVCWTTPIGYRGDCGCAFNLGRESNERYFLRPSVPPNVQNSILAHLLDLLDGVAEYHQKCCANTRARKRRLEVINGPQYRDAEGRTTGGNMDVVDRGLSSEIQTDPLALPDTADGPEPPLILKSLICGINAVTKQLEAQIEYSRPKIVLKSTDDIEHIEEHKPIIRYLFVCRADVDPPVLIDHLPHLVATYNALRQSDLPPTILVPLPKGAEAPLAQAMGVRRLAALAIDVNLHFSPEVGG